MKLTYSNSIFTCLCFIKIITRALILGYEILYMDESSILSKNNNYRCWRMQKEPIYYKMENPSRSNLLLMIRKNKIIHFKINTTENTFLEFMTQSLQKIKEKK